jgi:hypothetical protein
MPIDYETICQDNVKEYGTAIDRIARMLLADRYSDKTHFIYELLQNAEDALRLQGSRTKERKVAFSLWPTHLTFSHFGKPFDERDVRSICGIAQSTKDEDQYTSIGHFGIGFKSVYAYTDSPQVHCGHDHFAIDHYVRPRAIEPVGLRTGETLFRFDLRSDEPNAASEIESGLVSLGMRILLFLREIEEIEWRVGDAIAGQYLRSKPQHISERCRKFELVGQRPGSNELEAEEWLVFSSSVQTPEGKHAGGVEVAFRLGKDEEGQAAIVPQPQSPLAVYFPTAIEMNVGFLLQGPYRTTPSRDNIPHKDPWNIMLAGETAILLVQSLKDLKSMGLLGVRALEGLPIAKEKFPEGSLFRPMYESVRAALKIDQLIPCYPEGHIEGASARLAQTAELRELIDRSQLKDLYASPNLLGWVASDITQAKTPSLRRYLIEDIGVPEVRPEQVVRQLAKQFLERQSDDWIQRLYSLLLNQAYLRKEYGFADKPWVRLSDGTHVPSHSSGQPNAFLPGLTETGFPTVRATVCATEESIEFLKSLGLTPPDSVDDVVRNILPAYAGNHIDISSEQYARDISKILLAYSTDSAAQKDKLQKALRHSRFVKTFDASNHAPGFSRPEDSYLPTERLKALFEGIGGINIVDDTLDCLQGEDIRSLLEWCGCARTLRPVSCAARLTAEELIAIRRKAGCEPISQQIALEDQEIVGLTSVLRHLPALNVQKRRERAALVWEALIEFESRYRTGQFSGTYAWSYHMKRSAEFDASFVRSLNRMEWVPDENGTLHRPSSVLFNSLGWVERPFLLTKVQFKQPVLDSLAQEAGIDLEVLELLKEYGVTSAKEFMSRLQITKPTDDEGVQQALAGLMGGAPEPTPAIEDPTGPEPRRPRGSGEGPGPGDGRTPSTGTGGGQSTGSGQKGRRQFISYVATSPDEEPDPDGLDKTARNELEAKAITHILEREPQLKRTAANNPGFDLFETDSVGRTVKWVEVKSMKSSLDDRPVGMSQTQFECAQKYQASYWLYVVEHADDAEIRILRIQDPAGKASTFTFDKGWKGVATIEATNAERKE